MVSPSPSCARVWQRNLQPQGVRRTSTRPWRSSSRNCRPRPRSEDAASSPRLATIQPDLIGEAAIIEAFSGASSAGIGSRQGCRTRLRVRRGEAARVLVRLLQDFAYAIEDETATEQEKATARRLMGWLLSLTRQVQRSPSACCHWCSRCRSKPRSCAEAAAELTERVATVFRQRSRTHGRPCRVEQRGDFIQQPGRQAERSGAAGGGAERGRGGGDHTARSPRPAPTPSCPIWPARSTTWPPC